MLHFTYNYDYPNSNTFHISNFDRRVHVFNISRFGKVCLQIPNPKVTLFGTFSKISQKIRKISKFQNDTKIALVDEFHRNLRQTKGIGLIFRKKLKKLIFDYFCMFYSILNIGQIRIFENDGKFRICSVFEPVFVKLSISFENLFL